MSGLGFNKIAGAALATGLAIVGLNQLAHAIYASPEHVEKAGYAIEVAATGEGAPAAEVPPDWGTVLPAADVAAGQAVFGKCLSCHKPTDENGTGPGLNGIVGRKPGSHAGFKYSAGMTEFAAKTPQWNFEHLDAFLKNPKAHVPGTAMGFVGLKKQDERINIIAFLHTLNSSLPFPAPNPAAAAPAPAPAAEGQPTATGETAQSGQPAQAPQSGPAAAATQVATPKAAH